MSTVAKVMGSVIIKRTQDGVDDQLRPEQTGYRKGRSTTERISVLCNIIERVIAIEWNSFPYLCFESREGYRWYSQGFNMAFGAGWDSDQLEWFDVLSSVKQGCVMSAFLFRIVINWIMRKTTEKKLTTTLARRVDIADDIAPLFSKLNHSQDKLSRLNQFGSKTKQYVKA